MGAISKERKDQARDWLITNYSRSLLHMHVQHQRRRRLVPVLGAGIGKPLGFPSWDQLLHRVCTDPTVPLEPDLRDHLIKNAAHAKPAQHVLEAFRAAERALGRSPIEAERAANRAWIRILRKVLYEKAPSTPQDVLEQVRAEHPYLAPLLGVVRDSSLTVIYNFDDVIERCLEALKEEQKRSFPGVEREGRPFTTVTQAVLPASGESRTILYHLNGFIPRDRLERPSERVVLSEESFADQLLQESTGHFSFLLSTLQQRTCILVGLSLADPVLCHVLRRAATTSPGNCHYFLRYSEAADYTAPPGEAERRDSLVQFRLHNLVTINLDSAGMAALFEILSLSSSELRSLFEVLGVPFRQVIAITGLPGVGKTTSLSYFGNVLTYDEWLDPVIPEMKLPPGTQSDEQAETAYRWAINQHAKKNHSLGQEDVGLFVMDRCILDPATYAVREGKEKVCNVANELLSALRPGKAIARPVIACHVFILDAPTEEILRRLEMREDSWTAPTLDELREGIEYVYGNGRGQVTLGVSWIDVGGLSVESVAKELAMRVFLDASATDGFADLGERLKQLA